MNAVVAEVAHGAAQGQGLFKGIAVVIDDGLETEDDIKAIVQSILDNGGHAITLTKLPPPDADLENFANAAFFIMDWQLRAPEARVNVLGVQMPEGWERDQIQANIAFLEKLSEHRHAPVFIFTNQDVDDVKREINASEKLRREANESHILVMRKADVGNRVYEVLNEWAQRTPSVMTMKGWERSLIQATNQLFVDFHDRNQYWPFILWDTYKADGLPASEELGKLITRLVASRMSPLDIDLERFRQDLDAQEAAGQVAHKQAVLKVLEGERLLPKERLSEFDIAPGDLFVEPAQGNGKDKYFLNIRAECDCVMRDGAGDLELYLLPGKIIEDPEIHPNFGTISEKDPEAVVFAVHQGRTLRFRFKELKIVNWSDWRAKRVGRLLPPFITRVAQRYAAYSQRAGQPRIPKIFNRTPQ